MLSTTSEHALRALVAIARLPSGEAALARDVARHAQVPAGYLSKILAQLTRAGVTSAARGRSGGYRLARSAGKVTLRDIIALFDGPELRPACLLRAGERCSLRSPCTAHRTWRSVKTVYGKFLATTTLADIAGLGARGTRR